MPIYEYICQDCHNKFEKLVLKRDQEIACPSCGGSRNERQYSVFGFAVISEGGPVFRASSTGPGCGSCSTGACACCAG